jgi:hypothetical protein
LEDPLEGPIDEVVMELIENSAYESVEEEECREEEEKREEIKKEGEAARVQKEKADREQNKKDEAVKEQEEKAAIHSVDADLPAKSSLSGLQDQESSGRDSQGPDGSMDSLYGLQTAAESGSSDSSHQQEASYDFEYSQDHRCCTNSLRGSDTSYWNSSRDHKMESEIMVGYNLPAVPRTTGVISEMSTAKQNHEICEHNFARAYRSNKEEFEQERRRWANMLSEGREAFIESRNMHVAYIKERERAAREPVRQRKSPAHRKRRKGKRDVWVRKRREAGRKGLSTDSSIEKIEGRLGEDALCSILRNT